MRPRRTNIPSRPIPTPAPGLTPAVPPTLLRLRLARAAVLSGGAAKGAFSGIMAAHLLHLHTPRGVAMAFGAAAGAVTTSFMAIGVRHAYARLRRATRGQRPH